MQAITKEVKSTNRSSALVREDRLAGMAMYAREHKVKNTKAAITGLIRNMTREAVRAGSKKRAIQSPCRLQTLTLAPLALQACQTMNTTNMVIRV